MARVPTAYREIMSRSQGMTDNRSNEEWARKAKEGERGAMLALWEGVSRFIEWRARKYAESPYCRTTAEDLTQAGFFAMLDAVKLFEPERGTKFLTVLQWTLKKRFAEENGTRGTRRDALQFSGSLDEPRDNGEKEAAPVEIEDGGAALAFMGVEYADFLTYCRGVINAALDTLNHRQRIIVKLYYLEGYTQEDIRAYLHRRISSAAIGQIRETALFRLESGKYARELRECLEAFEDFHTYHSAANGSRWKETGLSQTEAAALVR